MAGVDVVAARPALSARAQHRLWSAAVALAALGLWQLLAVTVFSGHFVVPAPTSVVAQAFRDDLYLSDLGVTLNLAWKGWLIGNGAALLLAAICLVVPAAEGGLMTVGVATYCVPTIAIGPLLVVAYSPDGAKIVMSALSCFFITLVAAVAGLRAASPATLDAVSAFGGGRWQQLVKVRLRSSIPLLASGLSISAPAAILGVMIGDYLGGDRGLGVVMLQAQQQLAVERTWAIALVSTLACGLAFGLTALGAARLGADVEAPLDGGFTPTRRRHHGPARLGLGVAKVVGAVLFGLVVWEILIASSGLSSYFVKSPGDVWHYLATGTEAGHARHVLLKGLGQTMVDAGSGWVAGTVAALLAAAALTLFPAVGSAVMPFVIVLRSVPLIAMCPLIGLVFGRGLVGVTVIAGVVTFVPSLVTIVDGLRAVPSSATDVVHCFGGEARHALGKVRLPFSAPALFAAAKISMPGAVLGSVLAEWLITGHGLGYAMAYDVISSNYINLWASITVILIVSLGLYLVVGALESAARDRIR
ncbi:ABC transporter permease [Pseudofrankia inefficax]|uniref:Binding-protein-dependent transport systems inner membrane component n=1 Tax=Pseudofrankia inefficax (strain DSM 45817 / CECT 9037 / DDB 130130 / EuI1c) TaxID=298654 RepID=E3JD19_PSEI1|nr:ABC transporter permease subunit [Pseudofrankia inefficax]ADP81158.1 binding-protein-dependent transport systems inner membrane component [Pseudofrankia inefficax]